VRAQERLWREARGDTRGRGEQREQARPLLLRPPRARGCRRSRGPRQAHAQLSLRPREFAEETLGLFGDCSVTAAGVRLSADLMAHQLRARAHVLHVVHALRSGSYHMFIALLPHIEEFMFMLAAQQNVESNAIAGAEKTAFAWCVGAASSGPAGVFMHDGGAWPRLDNHCFKCAMASNMRQPAQRSAGRLARVASRRPAQQRRQHPACCTPHTRGSLRRWCTVRRERGGERAGYPWPSC